MSFSRIDYLSHPMTNDEFCEKLIKALSKAYGLMSAQIVRPSVSKLRQDVEQTILPHKYVFLETKTCQELKELWVKMFAAKMEDLVPDQIFWDTIYSEMFNHAAPISSLDIKEENVYKLKSSSRTLKVVDGDENTVVIQFLDNKAKMDLPRKDFDNECELVK